VDFAEAGVDVAIEFVEEVLGIVLPRTSRLGEVGMSQDVERFDAQSEKVDLSSLGNFSSRIEFCRDGA